MTAEQARDHAVRNVGIVADEFFDAALGRMGGFGWVAHQSAASLVAASELGYRPLFLAGRQLGAAAHASGVPALAFDGDEAGFRGAVESARISVLLTIDFRPRYLPVLNALARSPLIVWVQDPRTSEDVRKIATLRVPGSSGPPAGISWVDCSSLGVIVEHAETEGRVVMMAAPAPSLLAPKVPDTYGMATSPLAPLPYPLDPVPGRMRKSRKPRVLFLGRLDPIKRPWVFAEVARRFPGVEFMMLGKPHFDGPGTWQPSGVPANLHILGHVDGARKARLLESAWMIVNTSIHEALPISFLEALHAATPIVSCQNPEAVASRFGAFVGRWDGSGLDGLDAFSEGVEFLLDDGEARVRLGREGRAWARSTHTRKRFLGAFHRLVDPLVCDGS